jgi:predicted methyltransferase
MRLRKWKWAESHEHHTMTRIIQSVRGTRLLFATTVFVSAFLLFQIQPLISKAILPWFGGTPGVWTTCMLFFQMLLSGGYAYSHLLTARLPTRWQAVLHLTLLVVSLAFLNIQPSIAWKPVGAESPALRITLLLLSTVGLPYFILSTTGPLLLRWFSLIEPASSPYRLYALSNAGSLAALLSYPILFEPLMRISVQANSWSVGFCVFAALCSACVVRLWRIPPDPREQTEPAEHLNRNSSSVSVGTYAVWFLLAMIASTMLLAETNEVCQDVAVIPFLWVIPLSLYLLSFILCFESDRWYRRQWYALSTAVLVLAVCWLQSFGSRTFLPLQLAIYFGSLFSICMLCHGELARMRPDPESLTAFYLTLSTGGAGGGLFVGLLAPVMFPAFWEHYLGLFAALVIVVIVYCDHRGWTSADRRPPILWTGLAIVLFVGVGTVFAAAVLNYTESIAMVRNFYGVLEVETDDLEDAVVLRHGRIMHGLQVKGIPSLPTMYYGFNTGVGRSIEELRDRQSPLRIGLVGLGVGTLAAYGKAGDSFQFYEINTNVTRLAQQHFTFLSHCPSTVDIIHGDARLVLESETPQDFDLLVLDAFSGDAIPTHLLTREAMQSYVRHLRPNGLIAIHISNLHFDLRRVTDALAVANNLHAITMETTPVIDSRTGTQSLIDPGSRWVLLARDAELLNRPRYEEIAVRDSLPADRRVLWTDDFSNLIEVLDW